MIPTFFGFSGLERHRTAGALASAEDSPRSIFSTRGIVRVTCAGRRFLLKPGTILHLQGTETVEIAGAEGGTWELIQLRFTGKRARDYSAYLIDRYGSCITGVDVRKITALVRIFARSSHAAPVQLQRAVFRWFIASHRSAKASRGNLGRFVEGGRENLITTASAHGFSLASLAAHFGCSSSHLAERLSRIWGMSAGCLLQEARWEHVLRLLAGTRLRLRDIGTQCGYASPSAFNAAFKNRFGIPPGRLRNTPELTLCSRLPSGPAETPSRTTPPRAIQAVSAIIPSEPYFHFDGGEASYPFETPYKLMLNTVSDAMQWVCTLEGNAFFEVGSHRLQVTPGTVLVFPQPVNAQWVTPEGRPWRRVWLKLRGTWAIETLAAFVLQHGWMVSIPLDSPPVTLARKWMPFWQRHRSQFSFPGSEAAFEWFLGWGELLNRGEIRSLSAPDMQQFVSRSFFRRINSVTTYAQEIGYSRSYLSRKLKSQWNMTPQPATFLHHHRLAQAAADLRETHDPVSKIAHRCRYAHTSTFIAAFRREFGITPLQYRFQFS